MAEQAEENDGSSDQKEEEEEKEELSIDQLKARIRADEERISKVDGVNKDLLQQRKKHEQEKADLLEKIEALSVKKKDEEIAEKEDQKKYLEAMNLQKQRMLDAEERHRVELEMRDKQAEVLENELNDALRDQVIKEVSFAITKDAPELITPFVSPRIMISKDDEGVRKVVITDPAGKESAMSNDELVAEFKTNPKFRRIVDGVGSTGGGLAESGGGKRASEAERHFQPDSINYTKQGELKRENPTLYKALRDKYPDPNLANPFGDGLNSEQFGVS